MKKLLILLSIGLPILLTACTASKDATISTPASPAKEATLQKTGKADWEVKWESTLAEGKREGTVTLYTLWGAETRGLLTKAFKDKYGIDLQVVPFSRGPELTARVNAEKSAGLHIADVFVAGGTTLLITMKPINLLGPLEPLLILPEVKDSKVWRAGRVPFMDKENKTLGMSATAQRYVLRNTTMVKEGELTSYMDVLKPQYKGRIALDDPTVTGAGMAMLAYMAANAWNVETVKGFLRDLLTKQEAVIIRDRRTTVEWVARGKYAIGLGPLTEVVNEFMAIGSPISRDIMKEGTNVSPEGNTLAVPPVSAHPNATAVFINWLLSNEGQRVMVKGVGAPSGRSDVPVEGVLSIYSPQPGEKILLDTEEFILFRGEMVRIAKEVVDAYSK